MSQPKRRSRKSKLVPRSTDGEINEVIEKEPEIKIINTMSLFQPHASQPREPKKSESLQFKVDIEVEEWIDDELFIEENFSKMQSEKLSEALEREIKEEVDWTNDEYGKLWAEAASDSEPEERALNEYEKLIKNQIDPSLIAGPSKEVSFEPKPKNAKIDEKSKNQKKNAKKDKPVPPPQQTPKPSWKIKQYVRPAKKSKHIEPIKPVSDVNMQPKLKITVVFDEPVPESPVINLIDEPMTGERLSPSKNINETPVTGVNPESNKSQSNIKVNNSNQSGSICEVTAKSGAPKKINEDDETKKSIEETEETPSSSDMDTLLNRPIYFIEVNKAAEKINRAQLRQMAFKSILKQNATKNEVDLEHIVIAEDDIISASNVISKLDDKVAQMLNIHLRNRLGSIRFETIEMSREDALVDYALRQWFTHQGVISKTRSVPLLYKCYICNDGWWHLEPFRAHIKKHTYVTVVVEKHYQECSIIARDAKPVRFRMFPIDNECWRCSKSYTFHLGEEEGTYKCSACESKLCTCLALQEHMGICLSVWKKQMELRGTKDVRAFKCKICPQIYFSEEELHKHQYMFHVPRSDYPMFGPVRQCSFCNQNYILYMFHYCRSKVQKHVCKDCVRHFPSNIALNIHLKLTKLNVKCEFCDEVVPRECCMMEHLLKHTDKFMLVYKCMMCASNVMLENHVMVHRHVTYIHKSQKLAWCCSKMIIPRSLYKDNTYKIECKPSNPGKTKDSFLKSMLLGGSEANESDDSKSKDEIKDSDQECDNDASPKPDNSNHGSTVAEIPETKPSDTDIEPKIKIENVMDDYYEEDTTNMNKLDSMSAEIDIKPPEMPVSIKEEPNDVEEMEVEVNLTDIMDFDKVPVKEEKADYCEAETSEISKNSMEDKQFSEQIQNFLEKMDVAEYETMNQRGKDIKDNMYMCVSCDFEGTKRQYKNHIKECRSAQFEDNFVTRECTKCQKTFKTMRDYAKHLRVHGFITCHCKECDKQFPNLSAWSNHINSHINQTFTRVKLLSNDTRVFMCKTCKEIVQSNMFFKHWEVHIHQDSCLEVRYDSEGNISSKLLRIIHDIFQTTVKKNIPKNCVVCGRMFTRMNEKKRHLVEHLLEAAAEERGSTETLQCQICRAGFDKPGQFRRHMRDHAGLPVYHCELCDKTFSDSSNFVKHKKVHNMESYICDVCNKKFLAKTSLVAHIASHCEEPIRCMRCPDKLFYSESMYRKHVRINHDKVKNIACSMCRQRFQRNKELWDHQWEVHKMRSQIADCQLCDMKFRKVLDLRKHLATEHRV